jgi:hypothetical protein
MGIEQPQLLAAVHRVEGVVGVEDDALRNLAERAAPYVDQSPAQAQQRPRVRQVLQPGDGRLRTQVTTRRQPFERHLEHRIEAQAGGVVGVFVPGRDHRQAEAMMSANVCTVLPGSRGSSMQAARRSATDNRRSIWRSTSSAIRRQSAAVEPSDDSFAGNL